MASSRPMRSSKQTALEERLWTLDLPESRKRRDSGAGGNGIHTKTAKTKKPKASSSSPALPVPAKEGKKHIPPKIRLKDPRWVSESESEYDGAEQIAKQPAKSSQAHANRKKPSAEQSNKSTSDSDGEAESDDGSGGDCEEKESDVEHSGDDAEWADLPDELKEAEIPTWTTLSDNGEEEALADEPAQKTRTRGKRTYLIVSSPPSSPEPWQPKRIRKGLHEPQAESETSEVEISAHSAKKAKSSGSSKDGKKLATKGVEKRRLAQREVEEPKFKDDNPSEDEARPKSKKRRTSTKRGGSSSDAKIPVNNESSDAPLNDNIDAKADIELVYPESKWTELPLGPQVSRVREVVHRSIHKVSVRLLFVDAFPDGSTAQSLYAATALIDSAAELRYTDIQKRLKMDERYRHDLATIPSQRISVLRGPIKKLAFPLMATVYGLSSVDCRDDALWLLTGLRYIYPYHSGTKPDTPISKRQVVQNMPYRNKAILEVLQAAFFAGHPSHAEKYKTEFSSSSKEHPDELELPSAMLALAATAIGSSLRDWQQANGRLKRISSFTADANSEIYASHIKVLNVIKEDSVAKYHVLMHELYVTLSGGKLVRAPDTKVEDALAILDLNGMPESM